MTEASHPDPEIDRFVADILAAMSLKEKALIASMQAMSLPYLQHAFDGYISRAVGADQETGQLIMRRIWQALQATHRIRLVPSDGRQA